MPKTQSASAWPVKNVVQETRSLDSSMVQVAPAVAVTRNATPVDDSARAKLMACAGCGALETSTATLHDSILPQAGLRDREGAHLWQIVCNLRTDDFFAGRRRHVRHGTVEWLTVPPSLRRTAWRRNVRHDSKAPGRVLTQVNEELVKTSFPSVAFCDELRSSRLWWFGGTASALRISRLSGFGSSLTIGVQSPCNLRLGTDLARRLAGDLSHLDRMA
jgi:hypothetical protein